MEITDTTSLEDVISYNDFVNTILITIDNAGTFGMRGGGLRGLRGGLRKQKGNTISIFVPIFTKNKGNKKNKKTRKGKATKGKGKATKSKGKATKSKSKGKSIKRGGNKKTKRRGNKGRKNTLRKNNKNRKHKRTIKRRK